MKIGIVIIIIALFLSANIVPICESVNINTNSDSNNVKTELIYTMSGETSLENKEIYVDGIRGSDITGDGTINNPYATITRGISVAIDGDTVFIYPGEYNEFLKLVDKSINIIGITGDPEDVIISPIVNENALKVFMYLGGKIANVTLDNSKNTPNYVDTVLIETPNYIIDNCHIYNFNPDDFDEINNWICAIKFSPTADLCTLMNSKIFDMEFAKNNLIYLDDGANDISIINCDIDDRGRDSIGILLNDCQNTYIYNCNFTDCDYGICGMRTINFEEITTKEYNIIEKCTFDFCSTGISLTPYYSWDYNIYDIDKTVALTKIQDCTFIKNSACIFMAGCENQIIDNCTFIESSTYGINIYTSKGIKILNSRFDNNLYGININAIEPKGYIASLILPLYNQAIVGTCSQIEIINNTISNSFIGLNIEGKCSNINISRNTFKENEEINILIGFYKTPFQYLSWFLSDIRRYILPELLRGNFQGLFYNLSTFFIEDFIIEPSFNADQPSDNNIYFNDFFSVKISYPSNSIQVFDFGNNNWDNNSVGNYYEDYCRDGVDVDPEDGIIDYPYTIVGTGNIDSHPLKYSINSKNHRPPEINIIVPTGGECYKDTCDILLNVTDYDIYPIYGAPTVGNISSIHFSYKDVTNPTSDDTDWIPFNPYLFFFIFVWNLSEIDEYGVYLINVTVLDEDDLMSYDIISEPVIINKNNNPYLSNVKIKNIDTGNTQILKKGDIFSVETSTIGEVDADNVNINLDALGSLNVIQTLEEKIIWIGIVESNYSGLVYVPVNINNERNGCNYGSITLDNVKPIVEITTQKIFLLTDITISANIFDWNGIKSINWYVNQQYIDINNSEINNTETELFLEKDNPALKNGRNRIKVIVQDKAGNINLDEIIINKIG